MEYALPSRGQYQSPTLGITIISAHPAIFCSPVLRTAHLPRVLLTCPEDCSPALRTSTPGGIHLSLSLSSRKTVLSGSVPKYSGSSTVVPSDSSTADTPTPAS